MQRIRHIFSGVLTNGQNANLQSIETLFPRFKRYGGSWIYPSHKNLRFYSDSVEPTKDGRFSGKTAVVAGSTSGIGFQCAKQFAEQGANVMICSRSQDHVDKALGEVSELHGRSITGTTCDIINPEDRRSLIDKTVDTFGGIDILVCIPGYPENLHKIHQTTEQMWDKNFELNAKAPFFLAAEALPYMKKRGGGAIVTLTTVATFQPFKMGHMYTMSKAVVNIMTKSMAPELAELNIRVNSVASGLVKTGFSTLFYDDPSTYLKNMRKIPLNRFGTTQEISSVITFLCSDEASYITGENIVAAGGMRSRI